MGSDSFATLYRDTPPIEVAFRAGDPDPAGPRPVSFMRLARKPEVDGAWVFEREIAGVSGWMGITRNYEERKVLASVPTAELLCPRHVFRIADKIALPLPAYIMIAQHPYAGGWTHGLRWEGSGDAKHAVATLQFKTGSKKGPLQRPDASKQRFKDRTEALRWLDSHPQDYWDTSTDRLTAGILDASPAAPPNPNHGDAWTDSNLMVKGVCEDLVAAYRDLDCSLAAATLRELASRGILDIHIPKRGRWPIGLMREFDNALGQVETQMHLSIQQTLAGPHRDSEEWFGKPVVDLLKRVFRDNMHTCARSRGKGSATTQLIFESEVSSTSGGQGSLNADLREALAVLETQDQEAAELVRSSYLEGRTIAEIADRTRQSEHRVKQAVERGLAWLRSRFGK